MFIYVSLVPARDEQHVLLVGGRNMDFFQHCMGIALDIITAYKLWGRF